MLDEVNTAISGLLLGEHQSYSVNGRAVTRLDLNSLHQMQKWLTAQVSRESSGGAIRLAKMQRPNL
jgi:hypothetical protein